MTDLQSPARPSLIARLYARFEGIVRELGKFGTIGLVTFAVDTGVFNLLYGHLPPLAAATVSMTIAATLAFLGNRYWTWRDRRSTDLRREYALYFLFNLCGLGIALACLWLSEHAFGFTSQLADNIAKNGVGLVLGTAFRFLSYRYIVFRTSGAPARAQE